MSGVSAYCVVWLHPLLAPVTIRDKGTRAGDSLRSAWCLRRGRFFGLYGSSTSRSFRAHLQQAALFCLIPRNSMFHLAPTVPPPSGKAFLIFRTAISPSSRAVSSLPSRAIQCRTAAYVLIMSKPVIHRQCGRTLVYQPREHVTPENMAHTSMKSWRFNLAYLAVDFV